MKSSDAISLSGETNLCSLVDLFWLYTEFNGVQWILNAPVKKSNSLEETGGDVMDGEPQNSPLRDDHGTRMDYLLAKYKI